MKIRTLLFGSAAMLATAIAVPANAVLLHFTLTGLYSADWYLDSQPTPDVVTPHEFGMFNVTGTFPGTLDPVAIGFYDAAILPEGGGFVMVAVPPSGTADILTETSGPVLFTGDASAPTLKTGHFILDDLGAGSVITPDQYTLDVTVAGVPEPASWALMIGGLGAIGGALRGRKQRVRLRFA